MKFEYKHIRSWSNSFQIKGNKENELPPYNDRTKFVWKQPITSADGRLVWILFNLHTGKFRV
jgi:hypothetical protein